MFADKRNNAFWPSSNESREFSWTPKLDIISAGKTNDSKVIAITNKEKIDINTVKIFFPSFNANNF